MGLPARTEAPDDADAAPAMQPAVPMVAVRDGTGDVHVVATDIEAPFRLQAETYQSFAASSNFANLETKESSVRASVEEELRRLQIDPAVFYKNARRLEVSRGGQDEDEADATGADAESTVAATMLAAAQEAPALSEAWAPEAAESRGPEGAGEQLAPQAFSPPQRRSKTGVQKASAGSGPEEHHIETDADVALRFGKVPGVPDGSVPDEDLEEEHLVLEGATLGGRLGHETPRGMESRLQIDSLTDPGDDDDREDIDSPQGDGEDAVEAFTLDPEFDYDAVAELSRR